ncbi:MAG: hypothetical protein AAGF11_54815, partial [Myxococcota bacterium]
MSDTLKIRWVVGVDARELSRGARVLAHWLATSEHNAVHGVYVVEWMPNLARHHDPGHPDPLQDLATQVLQPRGGERTGVRHQNQEGGGGGECRRQGGAQ